MTDLTELSRYGVEALQATPEYAEYQRLRALVAEDPHLLARVKELMDKNFKLHQSDSTELFELMDALTNEYEDVINNELACDFMEAEVVLCRLVQELSYRVLDGLELD